MTDPIHQIDDNPENTVRLRLPLSPYMNRAEVADFLRIHKNSVDNLVRRDKVLTAYKIQGMRVPLYLRSEVEGLVVEGLVQKPRKAS